MPRWKESFNDEDAFAEELLDDLSTYDPEIDKEEPWIPELMEDGDIH